MSPPCKKTFALLTCCGDSSETYIHMYVGGLSNCTFFFMIDKFGFPLRTSKKAPSVAPTKSSQWRWPNLHASKCTETIYVGANEKQPEEVPSLRVHCKNLCWRPASSQWRLQAAEVPGLRAYRNNVGAHKKELVEVAGYAFNAV